MRIHQHIPLVGPKRHSTSSGRFCSTCPSPYRLFFHDRTSLRRSSMGPLVGMTANLPCRKYHPVWFIPPDWSVQMTMLAEFFSPNLRIYSSRMEPFLLTSR